MNSNSTASQKPPDEESPALAKTPRLVLSDRHQPHAPTIFAFPPNRQTLGGTAYLIVDEVNMLVDCPAWNRETQAFLEGQGGVRWLFLTHRGAMAQVREIQQALGCDVVVQEQEAYLLPQVRVTAFEQAFELTPNVRALWTAGHSPGSACLYAKHFGGVLFSGRHLLPNPTGELVPLKLSKTFHWQRQIQSLQGLLDQFSPETLQWICPGANLGFLRGKYAIANAYQQLERAMAVVTLPPSQPISQ